MSHIVYDSEQMEITLLLISRLCHSNELRLTTDMQSRFLFFKKLYIIQITKYICSSIVLSRLLWYFPLHYIYLVTLVPGYFAE